MTESSFDSLTRHAATVSRRGSFRVLGGAAVASAIAAPTAANAEKAGKKALKPCKRQKGGCEEVVTAQCAGNATCLNALLPCCALLGQCKGREATTCFLSG